MRYTVRDARPEDTEALARLSGEFGYPSTASDVARRLPQVLGKDDQRVLVATDEGDRPIGWIHVYVAYRIESDPFAEIGGMVVTEVRRSAGIGADLLARAEQWATQRGLRHLRVRSNVIREDAHRFYRRAGYTSTKTSAVFVKELTTKG